MRFRGIFYCFGLTAISLGIILALVIPNVIVAAAGSATVSILGPAQPVSTGQQFSISVVMQPNTAIAGAQFNLSFNPLLVTASSVSEGNIFKQNGASTFFTPGQINNSTGTITGVAGVITIPGQTVSSSGTFAVIILTAGPAAGTCPFTLSNVILGNTSAQGVPVIVYGGQVEIVSAASSPAPSSGGGGSGGGGGGASRGSGGSNKPSATPQAVKTPAPNDLATAPAAVKAEPAVASPPITVENSLITGSQDVTSAIENYPSITNNPVIPPQNSTSPDNGAPIQDSGTPVFRLSLLIEIIGGALLVFAATVGLILFSSGQLQRKTQARM